VNGPKNLPDLSDVLNLASTNQSLSRSKEASAPKAIS